MAGTIDYDRLRLGTFLSELEAAGELERRREPVALAQVAEILDGNPHAVLFENAGATGTRLAGNVIASRRRLALAFGAEPGALLPEILRRLRNKPEICEVPHEAAPVHEVVVTGEDVDLTRLPVHLQHQQDGGPYISAGIDFSIDRTTNLTNVGLRRFMLRGRNETGIDLVAASDLRNIYRSALPDGKPFPLSVVVGAHPIDYFASTMRVPVDEIGLISSLRGAPLPVVKCVTNDLRVPADAEFVLEGYLGAEGYIETEGPYGEFLGYYGGVKTNPVFHVTAMTCRRDAIFQTISISGRKMSLTDTAHLTSMRTETLAWRALEAAVREPVAVYAPTATGGVYNLRVAMRQRVPGEARNAIAAVFSSLANVKNVFVVDPDIDIFADEQMEWAMATRFRAERDVVIAGGFRASPLDPALEGDRVGSKAGFDLTLPFGSAGGIERTIPQPPRFEGRRFPTIAAALADGPKSFEELMTAIATKDGREVVLALDALRGSRSLQQDPDDGRYSLRSNGQASDTAR
jgi:2,5-furandicarboxylate decarboxylase 1